MAPALVAATCGDRCEALCRDVATQLFTCKPDSLQWQDLGARSRTDFVNVCRRAWERERRELSQSELGVALGFCEDTMDAQLSCDEIVALYASTP